MKGFSEAEISQFIEEGFLRLEHAFPGELADEDHELLWRVTGGELGNPATWTQAVIGWATQFTGTRPR